MFGAETRAVVTLLPLVVLELFPFTLFFDDVAWSAGTVPISTAERRCHVLTVAGTVSLAVWASRGRAVRTIRGEGATAW